MPNPYAKWMIDWETRLTMRDTNRIVRPFEWGLDWIKDFPCVNGNFAAAHEQTERYVHQLNDKLVAHSDEFYSYTKPTDYRLEQRPALRFSTGSNKIPDPENPEVAEFLRFTSPVRTPYPENDLVNARWFPAKKPNGCAMVVMPQWNSDAFGHNALCQIFNRFGISALRLEQALSRHPQARRNRACRLRCLRQRRTHASPPHARRSSMFAAVSTGWKRRATSSLACWARAWDRVMPSSPAPTMSG